VFFGFIRLVQRLIEHERQLADRAVSVENIAYGRDGWADEYKRILKLFEEYLRK
jgi:hypothetical protein